MCAHLRRSTLLRNGCETRCRRARSTNARCFSIRHSGQLDRHAKNLWTKREREYARRMRGAGLVGSVTRCRPSANPMNSSGCNRPYTHSCTSSYAVPTPQTSTGHQGAYAGVAMVAANTCASVTDAINARRPQDRASASLLQSRHYRGRASTWGSPVACGAAREVTGDTIWSDPPFASQPSSLNLLISDEFAKSKPRTPSGPPASSSA